MPLRQDRPYHHRFEDFDRPHALLSHEDLTQRLSELVGWDPIDEDIDMDDQRFEDPENTHMIDELVAEHYFRERENRIEPSTDLSALRELFLGLIERDKGDSIIQGDWKDGGEMAWTHQPMDEDFQDKNASDDVFEQAWGIAKFAAPANYLDEIQGRLGSKTPQPPTQEPGKQVCQGCNMAKMNIDPNTGMCSVCSARGPLNDRI